MVFEIPQSEYLQPKRHVINFSESISGAISNKTRYRVARFTNETLVLGVTLLLTNFATDLGTAATIQLVGRAVGSGSDGTWRALSSEIPSATVATGWTSSTNLNAKFPDALSEFEASALYRGADYGFGNSRITASAGTGSALIGGTNGGTIATLLQVPYNALPFMVGADVVEIGFDVGGSAAGQTAVIVGGLSIVGFDRDKGIVAQASLGGKYAPGISFPFGTLDTTNGGYLISGQTGQTTAGVARSTIS